jgi:L-seryl-tRNA(Ser) seleniumtransferase
VAAPMQQALAPRYSVEVADMESQVGSGSAPTQRLASAGLRIVPNGVRRRAIGAALSELAAALRALPRPVIGRIGDDALHLDCRCLEDPGELLEQAAALRRILPPPSR